MAILAGTGGDAGGSFAPPRPGLVPSPLVRRNRNASVGTVLRHAGAILIAVPLGAVYAGILAGFLVVRWGLAVAVGAAAVGARIRCAWRSPTASAPRHVAGAADIESVLHRRRPAAAMTKRAVDVVASAVLLLLAAPVLLFVAAAIRIDSPGPVLFRQHRRGLHGRTIQVLKLRTMHVHGTDPEARTQTRRGDPRVTRVGAFLRRHSLDELPQLINVLKGDMSLVGPRPHALGTTVDGAQLDLLVRDYHARYRVRPGLTGWAQVNGCRGELDRVEKLVARVQHDLYYIENWSLALDVRIMLRTVACVVRDHRAY